MGGEFYQGTQPSLRGCGQEVTCQLWSEEGGGLGQRTGSIKMGSLVTWSQHPGPELLFLEVATHFVHPGSRAVFSDSSGRCSLEGGRALLPPHPGLWP